MYIHNDIMSVVNFPNNIHKEALNTGFQQKKQSAANDCFFLYYLGNIIQINYKNKKIYI